MKSDFIERAKKQRISDFERDCWQIADGTKEMLMELDVYQLTKKIDEWRHQAANSKILY